MDATARPIQLGDLVQVDAPGQTTKLWIKPKETLTSIHQIAATFSHEQREQRVAADVPFILVDHGTTEIFQSMYYTSIAQRIGNDYYAVVGLFADYGYLVYWESLPRRMQLKHATQEQNK